MKVVCDAGPLIALSKLGQLGLLIQNIKAEPTLWISERVCDQALKHARNQRS